MSTTYSALYAYDLNIPERKIVESNFGQLALDFIRDDCVGLKFDEDKIKLQDTTGKDGVPYNFERDVDRLCFESAIARFLESGTREDAFDVYFCFCEIFKPFGEGYQATKILIETLSEHEENSSSLLMKHRDHYSHSVYVYLLGIALYKENEKIRNSYDKKYQLKPGNEACHHFLEYWGMTALFHDIGYPFEIAHQQIKTYICQITGFDNKKIDDVMYYAPYVSYSKMDEFVSITSDKKQCLSKYFHGFGEHNENLNSVFATAIEDRLSSKYGLNYDELYKVLDKRAIESQPYMDHAYFSGLILLKKMLENLSVNETLSDEKMDILTAITLHNSLFKFELKGNKEGFALEDGQPLAYLLMLCDELQCWDRTAYGQNSRTEISPFNFDIGLVNNSVILKYYFDQASEIKGKLSKNFRSMSKGYKDKQGHQKPGYKFVDDLNKIVSLNCFDDFSIQTDFVHKLKKKKQYLSDTNFLNLYEFALALNGRYDQTIITESLNEELADHIQTELQESFARLTLEFKLSNIAQAKGFASHLEKIGCFYTDRAVDYEVINTFTAADLEIMAQAEHQRWQQEKLEMGWLYGTDYLKADNPKRERALTRKHKDITPFSELTLEDILKDSEPMNCMLKLLYNFDGLRIYKNNR